VPYTLQPLGIKDVVAAVNRSLFSTQQVVLASALNAAHDA
jgi:hypothetical protein